MEKDLRSLRHCKNTGLEYWEYMYKADIQRVGSVQGKKKKSN